MIPTEKIFSPAVALHASHAHGPGEAITDILLHTARETLTVALFMFLTYLLMESIEHRSAGATGRLISRAGKAGPAIGGLLGIIPQCGFSAAASGLYAGRLISRGTLLAVFLSTSDEMLPMMLSGMASGKAGAPALLTLLAVKLIGAIAVGFAVDLLIPARGHEGDIEDFCEVEGCNCEKDGILISALKHTAKITIFVLIATLTLNTAVHFIGEENIAAALGGIPVLGELIAALIGLIPNCAASVVLTELYVGGAIGAGQLLAGLFTGAGIGLLVLFRTNRRMRDNLTVLALLLACGFTLGTVAQYSGLTALLGL